MSVLRGPVRECTRSCSECADACHHWVAESAANEPNHAAALQGLDAWWGCKHCAAWVGDSEDCIEDGSIDEAFVEAELID